MLSPRTPEELAEALHAAAAAGGAIALGGASTKRAMAGPCAPAEVIISTAGLSRIRQYDPRDLTISVEAGAPFAELRRALAAHGQMIPLDPPFSSRATIGGVLAANTCGPRRALYGAARDMVIGMKMATLAGKLVESGGMVVKNVAGLDTAKLMVGSFGTLAAIAVVNLKVTPAPPASRTFALEFASAEGAIGGRQALRATALRPAALDLLNPAAAARVGLGGWVLLVRACGSEAVIARYARELNEAAVYESESEQSLWEAIEEFTPRFLAGCETGCVVRVSCPISQTAEALRQAEGPALARAASGVVYACFTDWREAGAWAPRAVRCGWNPVIEFAPESAKCELELWPQPGSDFALMQRIKRMFDPAGVLNSGRLYGRL